MDTMLTTEEAAVELGLDESHVRRLCRDEKIAARKRGHDWFVSRRAVEDYKVARRKPGPVPVQIRAKVSGEPVKSNMDGRDLLMPVDFEIDADSMRSFARTMSDLRHHDPRVKFVIQLPSDYNLPDQVRAEAERFGFDVEIKED